MTLTKKQLAELEMIHEVSGRLLKQITKPERKTRSVVSPEIRIKARQAIRASVSKMNLRA